MVCENNIDSLLKQLDSQTFERVGLDRLYYILADISKNYDRHYGFKILDVGCNNGLISNFMAAYGNQAIGIDNFAINGQGRYAALSFIKDSVAELLKVDIEDFLVVNRQKFDFVLLLSVAHQWEYGYAKTGEGKKNDNNIAWIMNEILKRTTHAVYYECPINEPGFEENYGIDFLSRYCADYKQLSIVKISETIASNGYVRNLYRISRNDSKQTYPTAKAEIKSPQLVEDCSDNKLREASLKLRVSTLWRTRSYSHPAGPFNSNKCKQRLLWEKIKTNKPGAIEQVWDIFEDGTANVSLIEGVPGMMLPNTPEWQKSAFYLQSNQRYQWTFCNSIRWLHDLTIGLCNLDELGIAHGDPYPYNTILQKENAFWVDLGNISDEPTQRIIDIYVFLTYTVSRFLLNTPDFSDTFADNFKSALSKATNLSKFLSELAKVFSAEYFDVRDKKEEDLCIIFTLIYDATEIVWQFVPEGKMRYLPTYNTYFYFNEFIIWYHNSNKEKQVRVFTEWALLFSQYENARLRVSKDVVKILEHQESELRAELELEIKTAKKKSETIEKYEQQVSELCSKLEIETEEKGKIIEKYEQQVNELRSKLELETKTAKVNSEAVERFRNAIQMLTSQNKEVTQEKNECHARIIELESYCADLQEKIRVISKLASDFQELIEES